MPKSVYQAKVPWQAGLAIDQWIAHKSPDNSLLVLPDLPARSWWISKTQRPLYGYVEIDLRHTVQFELVRQIERYLDKEVRIPGSRDDWLFEILHHPIFGLDKMALAEQSIRFFRNKRERSYRQFLLKKEGSLSFNENPVQGIIEGLLGLRKDHSRKAVAEFLVHYSSNTKSTAILQDIASQGEGIILLTLDEYGGFPVECMEEIQQEAENILICMMTGQGKEDYSKRGVTLIASAPPLGRSSIKVVSPVPNVKLLPEEWLKQILANYTLSVSHLNKLLRCPLSFYFETILRSPLGKHPSMAFGSAVHYAMVKAFRNMLRHAEKRFPRQEEIAELFERSMEYHQAYFEEEDYYNRLDYGKQIIQRHFDDFREEWSRVATIERHVKTEIEGVPVHGFIDKIEFDYYRAIIVDYKTGDPKGRSHRLAPPGHAMAKTQFERDHGGNYWRQAVFYYLLVKYDGSNKWNPSMVLFEYLEPKEKAGKRIAIIPGEEEQQVVIDQIIRAKQIIDDRSFDKGCGAADCQWCRFVTMNNYPTSHS